MTRFLSVLRQGRHESSSRTHPMSAIASIPQSAPPQTLSYLWARGASLTISANPEDFLLPPVFVGKELYFYD